MPLVISLGMWTTQFTGLQDRILICAKRIKWIQSSYALWLHLWYNGKHVSKQTSMTAHSSRNGCLRRQTHTWSVFSEINWKFAISFIFEYRIWLHCQHFEIRKVNTKNCHLNETFSEKIGFIFVTATTLGNIYRGDRVA